MFGKSYTTIERRGYKIVLPTEAYKCAQENKWNIQLITHKGKPTSVQIVEAGTKTYLGTMKTFLSVESFKDGNVCNFRKSNLIFTEE